MAFKSVADREKTRIKTLGVVKKAKKHDGFYLKIDDDCDLILYVPESREYFKVLRTFAKFLDVEGEDALRLSVDLDSPLQLELKAKDD